MCSCVAESVFEYSLLNFLIFELLHRLFAPLPLLHKLQKREKMGNCNRVATKPPLPPHNSKPEPTPPSSQFQFVGPDEGGSSKLQFESPLLQTIKEEEENHPTSPPARSEQYKEDDRSDMPDRIRRQKMDQVGGNLQFYI
jgi:hypothetical protein